MFFVNPKKFSNYSKNLTQIPTHLVECFPFISEISAITLDADLRCYQYLSIEPQFSSNLLQYTLAAYGIVSQTMFE